MSLLRIRTDFNSNSLANIWTIADLARQNIELYSGLRCVFYDLDAEEGEEGLLHGTSTIWWDEDTGQFRIDMKNVRLRFTPGNSTCVLDNIYDE